MHDLEIIRKQAHDLANAPAASPEALLTASELLKNAEAIENHRAQTKKLREEGSQSHFMKSFHRFSQILNPFATLITVAILAITLTFQYEQQRQTQRDRADDQDDARWSNAVKSVADTQKSDPTAAIIQLKGVEQTSRLHRDDAAKLIISILRDTQDFDGFHHLFSEAFPHGNQDDLDDILDLNRAIHQQWVNRNLDPSFSGSDDEHKIIRKLGFIGTQVHPLLQKRAPNQSFDLSFVALFDCSLSYIDLTGANLEGFTAARVSMPHAKLGGVTQFENGYWKDTVWWDADVISPQLLEYLKKTAKFTAKPEGHYGADFQQTESDYENAVKRLENALAGSAGGK